MLTSTLFWQFLQPCWCQTVAALLFLWIHQWDGEGGQVAWATACPPYHNCPGLYPSTPSTIHLQPHLERTLQLCHLHGVDSTQEAADTSYKPSLNWHRVQAPGVASDGGRDLHVSLDSYHLPQAGQPPASKVLSCHGLLSSLGAWRLGNIQQAVHQLPHQATTKEKCQKRDQL